MTKRDLITHDPRFDPALRIAEILSALREVLARNKVQFQRGLSDVEFEPALRKRGKMPRGAFLRAFAGISEIMPRHSKDTVAVLGIDIGKNTFHLVGLNKRGAIILRQKLSRTQLEAKLANLPSCLVGMEACVGAHHLSRRVKTLGHDPRLMPAKYVKAFLKGNKNDFRDAEAIAEAVQRPTMRFVATKTAEQLDLQALHRVRSRLVSERTATVNEVRAFLLDRGIAVAQGLHRLRAALPGRSSQRDPELVTPIAT